MHLPTQLPHGLRSRRWSPDAVVTIATMTTNELVAAARKLLRTNAISHFDPPIQLASGQMSTVFIDGKAALAAARDLELACRAMHSQLVDAGIEFDAVGGLTLGADHLAVGIALVADASWFIVRKRAKQRGTAQRIEGARLGPGVRVVLVEDVVSTGGSMFAALDAIEATGADIVAATTLIDRGDIATAALAGHGIPYFPLGTYHDFDLAPVEAV